MPDSKPSSTLSSDNVITTAVDSDAKASQNVNPEKQQDDGGEYVTGYKLAIIVASIALSCFLMLLDTMIISTVS